MDEDALFPSESYANDFEQMQNQTLEEVIEGSIKSMFDRFSEELIKGAQFKNPYLTKNFNRERLISGLLPFANKETIIHLITLWDDYSIIFLKLVCDEYGDYPEEIIEQEYFNITGINPYSDECSSDPIWSNDWQMSDDLKRRLLNLFLIGYNGLTSI